MTEPLKQSTFGGVNYNLNKIVKKWVTNENGATRYHLILGQEKGKTIEVSYPQQKSTNGSSIFTNGRDTVISNLAYGKVIGSDADEVIELQGCNGTEVDVSNDNNIDQVNIFNSKKHTSKNNKVIGSNDEVFIRNGKAWDNHSLDGNKQKTFYEATAVDNY